MAIRFAPGTAGQAERSGISGFPPDTIIIDHWHTRHRDSIVESHDTIRIVVRDSIPYPLEVPVNIPYTPPFYKNCTTGFWILLLIIVAIIILRALVIYIRYRARIIA